MGRKDSGGARVGAGRLSDKWRQASPWAGSVRILGAGSSGADVCTAAPRSGGPPATDTVDGAGLRRLDVFEAQIATLEAAVASMKAREADRDDRQRRARLKKGDPGYLARLLPAIHGAWGSDPFLSRHLAKPDDAGLWLVLQGRTAKTIGRLLGRAEGVSIGDYVLEACGKDPIERVRRWRVVGVFRGL